MAAVDDQRCLRQLQRGDRDLGLLGPARGGDGPLQRRLLERQQQRVGAGRRRRSGVELVVDSAGSLVDALLVGGRELAAGALRDLARELLAVRADETRDVIPICRNLFFVEGAQPRLDACLDRVDQRAVEVEDQRLRLRQPGQTSQRRFLYRTKPATPPMITTASTSAMSRSLPPLVPDVLPPVALGAGVSAATEPAGTGAPTVNV